MSNQSAFLCDKSIHGNIAILVHSMGKNILILIKLNLRKAFDSISWTAIHRVLNRMNFPTEMMIGWIIGL